MFTLKNIKSDDKINLTIDSSIKCLIDNNNVLSKVNIDIQKSILFLAQTCVKKQASKIKLDNPFKMASLFMGKNDNRKYLNYIYSNGTELIASNGHILIRIKAEHEPGFYNRLGVLCETPDFAKFPEFTRVIEAKSIDAINIDSGIESLEYWEGKEHFVTKYLDTVIYDSKYLNILRKIGIIEFELKDTNNIYFKKDNFDGVVMPIRV